METLESCHEVGSSGVAKGPPAPAIAASSAPSSSVRTPRWSRFELALGLELHLRDDASACVLELAARVAELARGSG